MMMYKEVQPQRLTQVGILRALMWPGFFLSTFLGSRVMQPAVERLAIGFQSYNIITVRTSEKST